MPYLGDSFRSYSMGKMKVPRLAKADELKGFTAPTLVMGADEDLSFPGDKVITRAKELFSGLERTELIEHCKHCPPTTPEFRTWLSEKISSFLQ